MNMDLPMSEIIVMRHLDEGMELAPPEAVRTEFSMGSGHGPTNHLAGVSSKR